MDTRTLIGGGSVRVFVFDNGGKTFDRFTLIILAEHNTYDVYGMSANAMSPQGFNQFAFTGKAPLIPNPRWGKRVPLSHLPDEAQKAVKIRRADYR